MKVIENVHRLNEAGEQVKTSVWMKEGKFLGFDLTETADEVIDGNGAVITPGFVDVHVHLREPGGEKKETIETGTKAAARGGYTTICAMPNTRPVPDTVEHLQQVNELIDNHAAIRVLPYASITIRQAGKELTDQQALADLGAFAFTDDGVGIQEAGKMYEAMKTAATIGKSVVAHCEDNSLLYGGVMHKGTKQEQLGLNGILSVSESVQIARDCLLAESTGAHYHVCHVSTKESVRVIRDAKRAGINVTAEVTPHHLLLCDEDIPSNDANWKMNPPLRSKDDQLALIEGLEDGTIDCIATDHAPHMKEEKDWGMEKAPFGIVGLETAFPLLYTNFVKTNKWSLNQLVDWLTRKPAQIFQLPFGQFTEGESADFVLLDLNQEQSINPQSFESQGTNTPFAGWNCTGWPVMTIFEGNIVWKDEAK